MTLERDIVIKLKQEKIGGEPLYLDGDIIKTNKELGLDPEKTKTEIERYNWVQEYNKQQKDKQEERERKSKLKVNKKELMKKIEEFIPKKIEEFLNNNSAISNYHTGIRNISLASSDGCFECGAKWSEMRVYLQGNTFIKEGKELSKKKFRTHLFYFCKKCGYVTGCNEVGHIISL